MLPIWVFCMCKSRGIVELRLFFILSFHVSFRSACRIVRHIYAWSTQKVHWSWEATSRKRTSFIFLFFRCRARTNTHNSPIFSSHAFYLPLGTLALQISRHPAFLSISLFLFNFCMHAKLYTNFNLLNNNGMDYNT